MTINWKKSLIVLVALNIFLTPAVHAAQNDPTFFTHVGSLVRDDLIFSRFVQASFLAVDEGSQALATVQGSAIMATLAPVTEPALTVWGRVTVTAYSSSYDETDDSPYVTARGTATRDGVIAANFLPFGTKVSLPELFGDKVFVVEDRMHFRYSTGRVDIWMPTKWEAKEFGKNFGQLVIVEES